MLGQRARNEDDKAERRAALLDAAEGLLASPRWASFTMTELAAGAGVSKATAFLYYPTREALLLGLFARSLGQWFDGVEAALARGGRWTGARVARTLAESFRGRVVLLRLLAQLEGVLERNVPEDVARAHKRWLATRVGAAGARLEERLPWLDAGDGARLLLRARAVVSGLWQMADASPLVDALLQEPELAPMRVRFDAELDACLGALLAGLELAAHRGAPPAAAERAVDRHDAPGARGRHGARRGSS